MAYFKDFPYVYEITAILSSSLKTGYLTKLIGYYYQSVHRPQSDVDNYIATCGKLLVDLYDFYLYAPNKKYL